MNFFEENEIEIQMRFKFFKKSKLILTGNSTCILFCKILLLFFFAFYILKKKKRNKQQQKKHTKKKKIVNFQKMIFGFD